MGRLEMNRNQYIGALTIMILFAALFAASLPGRDLPSAGFHAFADFKLTWLCAVIALWQAAIAPSRDLQSIDVVLGGSLAALAALTSGLLPWLSLILFAAGFIGRSDQRAVRQSMQLMLAIGIHEVLVSVCGQILADRILGLDALVAQFFAHWLQPEIMVSGSILQAPSSHSVMLVWGCSSLSYVGDLMLLCWALALFLAGNRGVDRSVWVCLVIVAVFSVTLNAVRLVFMASNIETYNLLHSGFGATMFRTIALVGAVGVAWLHAEHANRKRHCPA